VINSRRGNVRVWGLVNLVTCDIRREIFSRFLQLQRQRPSVCKGTVGWRVQESEPFEDTCTGKIKGNQSCRLLTWQEVTSHAEATNVDIASLSGKANSEATTESLPKFKIGATKSFSPLSPKITATTIGQTKIIVYPGRTGD
jgi:hypothetical protein